MKHDLINKFIIYDSSRKEFYGDDFCGYTTKLFEIGTYTTEEIEEFEKRSFATIKFIISYDKALKATDGRCYAIPFWSIELR